MAFSVGMWYNIRNDPISRGGPRRPGDLEGHGFNDRGPIWWYPHELMYDNKNQASSSELEEMKQKLLKELDK